MILRSCCKMPRVTFTIFVFLFLLFSYAVADTVDSMLEDGYTVNSKMRYISAEGNQKEWMQTSNIKAVLMTDSLPEGFVPTDENTVSTNDSTYPVYIFYDKKDCTLYFYTESNNIIMNPDSSFLFYNYPLLTDISGIANWDASHVTNMDAMFAIDRSLPDAFALRNWNTSNVRIMDDMFVMATSLMCIDVSNWDTGKVTSMAGLFSVGDNYKGNGQLSEILGLEKLDVSNVEDMTCMFYGAGQMTQYNIADWDVSKVVSMNHMFCDNFSLRSLDLSRWDVSNVKTMYCMFDDAQKLKTIGDVSHWNTKSLIDAGGWLNDARSFIGDNLGTLDLSGWNTTNLQAVGEMFLNTELHTIDLSGWTFDSITNDRWEGVGHGIYYEAGNGPDALKGFGQMFKGSKNLTKVYVSRSGLDSFNTAVENGVNIEDMWTNTKVDGFTVKEED